MSMFKIIIFGAAIVAALLAILIFSGRIPIGDDGSVAPTGQLSMWGTIPANNVGQVIGDFNIEAKTYSVNYRYIQESDFSQTLIEALANGAGPDMILAPHQIVLEQASKIAPFPLASFSEKAFKDRYVDGASILLTPQGSLGLPVAIEPMVLFFNRTILAKRGVASPPVYWDEVTTLAPTLTLLSPSQTLTESAIALGAYGNVPHAKEIIMTFISQLGQFPVFKSAESNVYEVLANQPVAKDGDILPLTTALRFYMQFVDATKSTYTWNQFMQNAQDAFVAEKLALYIGYLGEGKVIRERNQKADIDMTYLPQVRGYDTFSTSMKLHAIATLKSTKNINAAYAAQAGLASTKWTGPLAAKMGVVPAERTYFTQQGISEIVRKSTLVARGWQDLQPAKSNELVRRMIEEVTSGKTSVTDAAVLFVTRLQSLYTGF